MQITRVWLDTIGKKEHLTHPPTSTQDLLAPLACASHLFPKLPAFGMPQHAFSGFVKPRNLGRVTCRGAKGGIRIPGTLRATPGPHRLGSVWIPESSPRNCPEAVEGHRGRFLLHLPSYSFLLLFNLSSIFCLS